MTDWRKVTIQEIAAPDKNSLATGPFGSAISSRFFTDGGIPVIRGSNLSLDVGERLIEDDLVFISEELALRFSRSCARTGDLIFTCWGTVGQVGLIDDRSSYDEYIVSNKQMKLTPNPRLASSLFLYYAFSNPRFVEYLQSGAIGSSVPGFNLGQLRQLSIMLPPLIEQEGISSLLGAMDDKIAVNERTACTAYDIAEANYSLLQQNATRTLEVSDLLDLKYGKALPAVGRVAGPVPVYGSGGIAGAHDRALVDGPGIIVGRKGTVGTVYWSERSFFPIDTTFYVEIRQSEMPMEFAFCMLNRLGLNGMNSDSAVPGLNRASALSLRVKVPDDAGLRAFGEAVRPLFALRETLSAESAGLAELRDVLLPRLMSGEIRVRDAEKVVEEVT